MTRVGAVLSGSQLLVGGAVGGDGGEGSVFRLPRPKTLHWLPLKGAQWWWRGRGAQIGHPRSEWARRWG